MDEVSPDKSVQGVGPVPKRRRSLKRLLIRYRRAWLVYLTNHMVAHIISRRVRRLWYRAVMGYELGKKTSILPDFRVADLGNLVIGSNTVINNSCRFDNRHLIRIGDNVSISYGSMILTRGHDIDSPNFDDKPGEVVLEDYVWLCAQSTILPGVTVGEGGVVLTGSVVAKDVPPYTVVGGVPARKVRERNRDLKYRPHWDPRVPFFG